MNRNNNEYKTTNFYLSAYLLCKNENLIDIQNAHSKRADFVFSLTETLESLVHDYSFGSKKESVMVDARDFVSALRILRDRLYQAKERL